MTIDNAFSLWRQYGYLSLSMVIFLSFSMLGWMLMLSDTYFTFRKAILLSLKKLAARTQSAVSRRIICATFARSVVLLRCFQQSVLVWALFWGLIFYCSSSNGPLTLPGHLDEPFIVSMFADWSHRFYLYDRRPSSEDLFAFSSKEMAETEVLFCALICWGEFAVPQQQVQGPSPALREAQH